MRWISSVSTLRGLKASSLKREIFKIANHVEGRNCPVGQFRTSNPSRILLPR